MHIIFPYESTNWNLMIKKAILQPLPELLENKKNISSFMLSCIDLTTLEGTDNEDKIEQLCRKALQLEETKTAPAAVCMYPIFVKQAKKLLRNTSINVASVAGAFPSGQSPLFLRKAEVSYAIEEGADEIDMVISRGQLIQGNLDFIYNEVKTLKEACKDKHLKVILETGELIEPEFIYQASMVAMEAGADFIKTSTGKIAIGASLTAAAVMMTAINDFYHKTGNRIGIKIAGGVSSCETAAEYLKLTHSILGKDWLSNKLFRIGASRLADQL